MRNEIMTADNSDRKEEMLLHILQRRPSARAIVALLAQGYSRKEIASQLAVSHQTVDWHLRLATLLTTALGAPRNKGILTVSDWAQIAVARCKGIHNLRGELR
jgi:DNA-binding CsgD family transcriptional regulator